MLKTLLPETVFRRNVDPSRYRLEIDGLRFFAIMIVMVGHLLERVKKFWLAPNPELDNPYINGLIEFFASPNQGVLLFFAISGFIIAKQMQDVPSGRFDMSYIGNYYVRRMTRIFPPYYVILIVTFIAYYFVGLQPEGLNSTFVRDVPLPVSLAASMLYSHGALFDSMPRLFPLGWSLEVEVQFYILAPLIFLTLFRGADRAAPWRFAALLVTCFCVSFLVINKIVPVNSFTVASYIIYFAVGITIARHEGAVRKAFSAIGSGASLILGFGTVIGLFWLGAAHFSPLVLTLVYWFLSLGTIVVLFGLAFQPDTLFGKFCRIPVVTYIGLACYSLYMVHLQVFHIAALVAGKFVPMSYATIGACFALIMVAGLVAGAVFFIFVEKPFAAWRPYLFKMRKAS